jgi:uncharacterized repeat protein (TIGR01451 family)
MFGLGASRTPKKPAHAASRGLTFLALSTFARGLIGAIGRGPRVLLILGVTLTGISSYLVLAAPTAGAQTVSTPSPSSGPAGTQFNLTASGFNVPGIPPCTGPVTFSWDRTGSNQTLGSLPSGDGTLTVTAPNVVPQTYTIQAQCPIASTGPPAYLQASTSFTLTAPLPPPTTTTTTTTTNPTTPTTQPPTSTTTTTTATPPPTPNPGGTALPAVDPPCTFTTLGTTMTLDANCNTTVPIVVPDGFTLDGASHTITAEDAPPVFFSGGVVTNASGATAMTVQNLTIVGQFQIPPACQRPTPSQQRLDGIFFDAAGGTVSGVTISGIEEGSGCQYGKAIEAEGTGTQRTVTITNTTVSGYQKNGLDARGSITMNVSGSTVGTPELLAGHPGENGVVYASAQPGNEPDVPVAGQPGGTVSGSTITGSGDTAQGSVSTAMILDGAKDVTVTANTFTGAGTDYGILVFESADFASTGITISNNDVARNSPDSPDLAGIGITVCSSNSPEVVAQCATTAKPSSATLICNTFNDWVTNIVGALQIGCTLPAGTQCQSYSANLAVQGGNAPFTWSASGPLPPGLTLSSGGAITGTPTSTGTFTFTATVVDSTSPPLSASQDETITIGAGTCPAAGISLVKSANTTSFSAPGKVITYQFKVSNTGTEPLSNVVVTDPLAGLSPITCPGTSLTCTATYTTTSADVSHGSIMNTATATGKDPSGATVGPSSSSVVIASVSPVTPTTTTTKPTAAPVSTVALAFTGMSDALALAGLIFIAMGLVLVIGSRRMRRYS